VSARLLILQGRRVKAASVEKRVREIYESSTAAQRSAEGRFLALSDR
jgi:hypothetical protein